MNSTNFFMNAALRRFDYERYCRERSLHPAACPILGDSLVKILALAHKNIFAAPYFHFILSALYIAARAKYAIARLVVGRLRRRLPVHTALDLSLEPLASAPPEHKVHIYADRKKYSFRINDLLSLIHTALTHDMDFISAPLPIKNPYTGIPFRPETLYLVYLRVRESRFAMPHLFENFIKVNQSVRHFGLQNECALREVILKSNVKNFTPKMVQREVRQLFQEMRIFEPKTGGYRPVIAKHELIPVHALDQFKPWLYAYYIHMYSFNPYLRQTAQKSLVKAMIVFLAENPLFGTIQKGLIHTEVLHPVRPIPLA